MFVIKKYWLRSILKPFGFNLIQYNIRSFDRFLKSTKKKDLVGAEIGVHDGWHALDLMEYLPISKLILIDPYKSYKDYYESVGNPNKTQKALDERMRVAKRITKKYGDKVLFIRKFSEEAAELIKDASLDFVYIDGNHQYEFVKKDVETYYPKVKKGGVIGGDDYTHSPETESERFGVFKAVNGFFKNLKKEIFFYQRDWWVVK
jgi:hypothetical protein